MWRATFRNRKSPKAQSYNIWRSIYFKKNSTYYFEDIIYSNKLKGFFFKKDFFQESKTPNLDIIFLQKKILYFFASVIILLKTRLRMFQKQPLEVFYKNRCYSQENNCVWVNISIDLQAWGSQGLKVSHKNNNLFRRTFTVAELENIIWHIPILNSHKAWQNRKTESAKLCQRLSIKQIFLTPCYAHVRIGITG